MTAPLALARGDARLVLAPATGAAIARFTWHGRDVLRRTPDDMVAAGDVRAHACYPLVPYSNRIGQGRLAFDGRTYALDLNFGDHPHSIHGVGWQRPWRVIRHDDARALLAYDHRPGDGGNGHGAAAADCRAWPWPFRATQWFQLCDASEGGCALRMRLAITNTGSTRFPFGLGWHPFFPRTSETCLGFDAAGVWETDSTVMPVRVVPALGDYAFHPLRPIGASTLDNVYTGWTGETQVTYPDARYRVLVRGDSALPFTVVYIPAGSDYIALEPVTHMTDAFNRAERGETATGTRVLAPGESFSCTMEIAVHERCR